MSAAQPPTEHDGPSPVTPPSGCYRSPVRISTHLREDTWPLRADASEDILVAWRRARRLDVRFAIHGLHRVPSHDEARYDDVTQAVLFRRERVLTTCYSVDLPDITNDHGRAVREAVREQFWRDGQPADYSAIRDIKS